MQFISHILIALLVLSSPLWASPIEGDIVLFDSVATSGRMFRMSHPIKRVGILTQAYEEKATVQEIDYPSRTGVTVYRTNDQGQSELSEGMHEVMLASLTTRVAMLISSEGKIYSQGSDEKMHIHQSYISGKVLYLFQQGNVGYLALTDEAGWAHYQKYEDSMFEKKQVKFQVKRIALTE